MRSPSVQLGELLVRSQDEEKVDPDKTYLTVGILNRGRGLFKRPPQRGDQTKYQKYNRIHARQVIYSKLFGWEGSIALVEPDFDELYVSPEFPTFDIRTERAAPEYFRYLARWPGLHEMMAKCTSGLGQRRQRVQVEQLLSLRIPLPNVDEQHRLAARLEHLYKRRHEALRRAKHAASLVTALHDSICRVNGQVHGVGDVVLLERRRVLVEPAKTYAEIGVRSFGKGIFHKEPVKGAALGSKRVFEIHPGDLVLSNVFAWEGAIAFAGDAESGRIGSHRFLTYRTNPEVADSNYLHYFFLSEAGLPLIHQASPGAAGRNRTLGIEAFESLKIPLPDVDEQRRIGCLLDRVYEVLRRIEAREKLLDALVASALNEAFGGLG